MRHQSALLAVSLFLLVEVPTGLAQNTVIIQEEVAVSRVLAGHADIEITKAPADPFLTPPKPMRMDISS